MVSARSAYALALLLLSGTVLISAQSEESASIESEEIETESESKVAETTTSAPTAVTELTTGRQTLKGFVTPRPFVVDHPLYSSTWAAWSAWSFCANNRRIRVRACNTVRGFSCVGKNQETEPCANSLYHHHTPRPRPVSDYDVVDEYEDDRIEALKQLYPDESPSDVLERRRPNPNFLRIGTTTAGPKRADTESQVPSSVERAEEAEEKDTEEAAQAGQQPDADFKKAKGAKTETQEVPLQAEIEGALERLEVHRNTETRRQHSSNFQQIAQKVPYAHDGSMGTGYTLIRNAASAFSALDLLESTEETATKFPASKTHDADTKIEKKNKHSQAKIQKSKAALAKISELLDFEIDALEKKVTTKNPKVGGTGESSGLRAVFESRGEEAPGFVDEGPIDPRYSKLAGAFVGAAGRSTTAAPATTNTSDDKEKGADYVEYSEYSEVFEDGKRITMTPKPKTVKKKDVLSGSTIYDEAVLDTDKATYDQYEEWIGDDKTSKEIINRRTNLNKGNQHDSAIPIRPKASRTTLQSGVTPAPPTTTTTASSTTEKQRKINFDHSDFLKEILVDNFSDYEDVTNKRKLDGDASVVGESATISSAPRPHLTTKSVSKVTPSRSDQLNKVHELENLLGLPHQGLMDETLQPVTNPVIWATPTPQFRSEGRTFTKKTKKVQRKKINKVATVDVDNVEVEKNTNMIDSDIHTFDGDAGVTPIRYDHKQTKTKKKIVRNRKKFREQPALLDNDDFSTVKGLRPYPSMRKPARKGPAPNKALSIGVTGQRHRAIHDGQKAQEIIKSHKMLFRNRKNLRTYMRTHFPKKAVPMAINDDTVRALDWMMQSLGASELLEASKVPAKVPKPKTRRPIQKGLGKVKYQHARINSHARAEISTGIQQATRKSNVIDSVAIGAPVDSQRRPAPVHRPAKILPARNQAIEYRKGAFAKLHDSDLLMNVDQEGISRMKPLRKASAPGLSRNRKYKVTTTPLPEFPPDLRAMPPRQKSLAPVNEHQPIDLLPPPLDEASDAVRYPRNGAYGTGFELDGSSPDAAAYLAAEGTARPAKILPRRTELNNRARARGVKTATGVDRKQLIGGAYTSSSGAAAFPSKFVDQKTPPRMPIAGLPEKYLKSGGSTLVDSDVQAAPSNAEPASPTTSAKKPVPFVMHEGSMDERNTIAAEIERLEQLVNDNKEQFNAPTISDKESAIALPKEFEPLLSDPRLFEDALKEIKAENKALGITDSDVLLTGGDSEGQTTDNGKKGHGSNARWSPWGDWGECLCGQQLRTRACETADGTQVSGCNGSSYESQSCVGGSCPTA